jgi:hypothetical protein
MKSFAQSLALIATLVLLALGEEVSRPLNPPHQFPLDFSKKLTPLKTKAVTLSAKDSVKAIVYPVVVYEHANFEGVSGGLDVGRYDYLSFGLANDVLSSLTVRDGFVVTLYQHSRFGGKSKVFTSNAAFVGMDFNDITSSVVVEYGPLVAILFTDSNYGGASTRLGKGEYDMTVLAIPNDSLSSMRIPAGWRVTVFEHSGFNGRSKTFSSDTDFVGNDFNDIASGIWIH